MFDRGLWGEKEKPWLAFAHLCGISTSTMNNFKLPTWCHWTRAWEEMCTVGSFEPARASSAHQCWCSFCFKLWSPGCASKGQNFQAVVESCVVSRGQEEWDKSESLPCFLPLNLINKAFYECSWTDWHPYDPVRESKSESKLFEGHSSILSVCTFWLLQPQGFYLVNPIFPIYKHTHTHTHTHESESESCSVESTSLWPHTVHGILQVRILEWVAFPFSRGSSQPRYWTGVSCPAGRFFTSWATREAHIYLVSKDFIL